MEPLADRLACALERNDEEPNIKLAQSLAKQKDISGEILELFGIVNHGTKAQKHDAVKVLYELAALRSEAFGDKVNFAIDLLDTKDNRLVWGALTLVSEITHTDADRVFRNLKKISNAAENGSVIAKDRAFEILVKLASYADYSTEITSQIEATLQTAAPNQLPMYAEKSVSAFSGRNPEGVIEILQKRLDDLPTEAKRKRLQKVIKTLQNPPSLPALS